ncbi:MAG: DNA alkylation repair protein [Oscillospiraceae bacterium]|nr:DNA alkylation repair protein [Oscillospiraceae bacterium]
MTGLQEQLFAAQDLKYRDFNARLLPTVDPARVIGVRTPALRAIAKDLARRPEAAAFMAALPHTYYEEDGLHCFLIEGIRDYDVCVEAVDAFLPYVDNWGTCDGISPRAFEKNRTALIKDIRRWMDSGHLYTVRFGIRMLMNHYLDEDFQPDYLDWVAAIETEEYYLRMMQAWYFATALAKQYDAALPILEAGRLEPWTHNKTIQKAVESYRITDEQKAYLKTLRRKRR